MVLTLDDSCEGCISCDQLVLICNQKCSAKGVKTLCGIAIPWGRGREDSIDEVTFEISLSRKSRSSQSDKGAGTEESTCGAVEERKQGTCREQEEGCVRAKLVGDEGHLVT